QIEFEVSHPTRISHCVFAGDGDRRLLVLAEEKASLWDLNSRQMIQQISVTPLDERIGRLVSHTHDRHLMAINVQSNVIGVLNVESGAWLTAPLTLSDEVQLIALSEDGRMLATCTRSEVRVWDTRNSQPLCAPFALHEHLHSFCFSEDGRWLACV